MRLRHIATSTALALAAVPVLVSSASSADTTIGESFTPDYAAGCGSNATILQTGSSGPSYTVPSAGVITSWRITGAAGAASTRAFKVGRSTGANAYSIVASTTPTSIPAGQTLTQNARIPVQAGDVLGLSFANSGACAKETTNQADTFVITMGDAQPGPIAQVVPIAGYRFPVAATVEADADADGYGDTTQDKCSTDATTQGACKDTTAPQTTINSVTATKIAAAKPGHKAKKKGKVAVTFSSNEPASFSCSVDGAPFTACTSPLKLKLKKGTHTIAVKATDTAGNIDATPATATVKVKVKKAKRK